LDVRLDFSFVAFCCICCFQIYYNSISYNIRSL